MIRLISSTALAIVVGAIPLGAQEWSGSGTIYGWYPTFDGNQDAFDRDSNRRARSGPTVNSDDILDALDFAFFATGEVRRDRFGVMLDFSYVDFSSDTDARAPFKAEASTKTKLFYASLAASWRLRGDTNKFVDAYGGFRYYNVQADIDFSLLDGQREPSINVDASWFDPIIGMKARYPFSKRWSWYGLADVGGFGIDGSSDLTWQAYSGVNFMFTDNIAANFGYRYMSIDYDDEIKVNTDIYGPIFGLTYRF